MEIVLSIPDEVLRAQNGDTARRVLEAFALEGYKSCQLSHAEVGRLLGFGSQLEVDGFLKEHDVYNVDYTDEELALGEEPRETIGERLERKGLIGIIDSSSPNPDSPPIHTPFGQLLIEKFRKQGLHTP